MRFVMVKSAEQQGRLMQHRVRDLLMRQRTQLINALRAAKDQGLDMLKLEKDMASDEVGATLREDVQLASAVGIIGTPGYVIGKDVVLGAIGIAGLKRQIDTARGTSAH
jgi:protein-disulfide isomerase